MATFISNCRVPVSDGSHAIEKITDGWVMTIEDFDKLYKHYKKNVAYFCGELCKKNDIPCELHKKIYKLSHFYNFIQEKIIDDEQTTIFLIKIKECKHSYCFGWCFSIL